MDSTNLANTALLLVPINPSDASMIDLLQASRYTQDPIFSRTQLREAHRLRLDKRPKNVERGFAFGGDVKSCDFLLYENGISCLHFFINFNPTSGILVLYNESSQGTTIGNVRLSRAGTSAVLEHRAIIRAGKACYAVEYPDRAAHQRSYEKNQKDYVGALDLRMKSGLHLSDTHAKPIISYGHVRDYIMLEELGVRGSSAFYLLAHQPTGNMYSARTFKKVEGRERETSREVDLIRSFDHPNIVEYVDYFTHGSFSYIVMEHFPCGTLRDYPNLRTTDVLETLRRIVTATKYLHGRGLTHGDLNPGNVVVQYRAPFVVKLVCLKPATPRSGPQAPARNGIYPAPETIFQSTYNPSMDIWSTAMIGLSLLGPIPEREATDLLQRPSEPNLSRYLQALKRDYTSGRADKLAPLWPAMLNRDPEARARPDNCVRLIDVVQDDLTNDSAGMSLSGSVHAESHREVRHRTPLSFLRHSDRR